MLHRFLGFANVIQIALGAKVEFAGLGKVSKRLGKALCAGVEIAFQLKGFLTQLFFEQGVEDDGRGAGIFEAADPGDFLRKRGSGGDQRRAQLQAKIFRA